MSLLRSAVQRLTFKHLVIALILLILLAITLIWWRTGAAYLRPYSEQAVFFHGETLRLPPELAGPGPIRVVHFWDPACKRCNKEPDAHLRYLIGIYRFAGIEFYSVQRPGSSGELAPFLQGHMKALPAIEGMEALPASPALAIWDKDGELAYAGPYSEGLVCNSSNSFVEPVLDALTSGRKLSLSSNLAVGCYCDWGT
ncbi:DUF6436 domain-containing protein [Stutzerimonas kirkiae]|uniref:Thiol-disulfide isomerase n=1 Tax=Stutzerimonas kirkiae TaxID=2211392 RepID=A0A4Q9RE02_9GAMM|nr:DUF6436 domain-containing protein [Stutzerimonas kirkiae]TBU98547.1 thiol-disulfide isomerase [Stutzerimonas kirkiae]TBV04278.1 thiol-disulfide isomerase [Stutzerimonas kirkiae]TBV10982.1 thiol-disulfide isomerase [Stutzerimonas kirkiae]TBV14341.1 thiol-disulfide isomerase [Stutzerimonas kirkiae]